jgi:Xaa-Pro aminopeptidase
MEVFAKRRQRVLEAIDGVAVVPSAPVTIRNNDVEHEYRQDSDFFYLTGFDEPEAVLILSSVHEEHGSVLFVRPRDPEREVWDGARAGVEQAKERCGVDATYPISAFEKQLDGYISGAPNLYYEMGKNPDHDVTLLAAITKARGRGRNAKPWPSAIRHPEPLWHEMRLFKDEAELTAMRRASEITAEAHAKAMRLAAPGKHEYEIEALMREVFRKHGSERPAYTPIVGSGPNATVLHYHANNRKMVDGDLLLIDAGCEFDYYAADVTRTFPVNGRFSAPQRRVYEAVLQAQLAALEVVRPDSNIEKIHEVTLHALIDGMIDIGLLSGTRDENLESEKYRRFFMHRTSHWLGMDVHDVGAYFRDGSPRPLAPGMVLTVEPGIYVGSEDAEAPKEYRGIGVRIEDDILVTADGHENLSAAVPKTADDIERACSA